MTDLDYPGSQAFDFFQPCTISGFRPSMYP